MEEKLYPIEGFEKYMITKSGKVWSKYTNKYLKQNCNTGGYLSVKLSEKERCFEKTVHRILAITFMPNPENKRTVNHISGIKIDNSLDNLEWATYQENSRHSFDSGLQSNGKGESHNSSKLTEIEVLEIRKLKGIKKIRELAIMYNISMSTISHIQTNRKWKHL